MSACARRACSAVSRDTASWGGDRLRSRNPCEVAAVTAWITGGTGSCSGRGSNADCGTVGIKAEALSSSSAAARSAGGWSACSSRAPSRSTSVQTRRPGNSSNSTFISSSSWFWIPRPRDSSVVRGCQITQTGCTAKETRACSPTHCLDASPCTRLVPPRFDGGLVFHTMMTSSARRAVCVHGRAQNKFGCDH